MAENKENQPGKEIEPAKATTDSKLFAAVLPDEVGWDELVRLGKLMDSFSRWVVGDIAILIAGQASYGDNAVERYADAIGMEYSTIRGYKMVSKAFPPESVARTTHPWSVYKELKDQPDRKKLIERKKPWTVAEARQKVEQRQVEEQGAKDRAAAIEENQAARARQAARDKAADTSAASDTTSDDASTTTPDREPSDEELAADQASAVAFERQAVRLDEIAAEIKSFEKVDCEDLMFSLCDEPAPMSGVAEAVEERAGDRHYAALSLIARPSLRDYDGDEFVGWAHPADPDAVAVARKELAEAMSESD